MNGKFLEPKRITRLLKDYHGIWAIAGGWAIDLYLNKETRHHQDIEIAIPRKEQFQLKRHLGDWDFRYVDSGTLMPWENSSYLELPLHEIHAQKNDSELEILLNEIENDNWLFRRNPEVVYLLEKLVAVSPANIPFLCPEVVLLYKAKWNEEKDRLDFANVLPSLNPGQKMWLKKSLEISYGKHEWVEVLK